MDKPIKFGDWTVIEDYYVMVTTGKKRIGRSSNYICQCKCGLINLVRAASCKSGKSYRCQSCAATIRSTTHGYTSGRWGKIPEYISWCSARQRCNNNKDSSFYN